MYHTTIFNHQHAAGHFNLFMRINRCHVLYKMSICSKNAVFPSVSMSAFAGARKCVIVKLLPGESPPPTPFSAPSPPPPPSPTSRLARRLAVGPSVPAANKAVAVPPAQCYVLLSKYVSGGKERKKKILHLSVSQLISRLARGGGFNRLG